ncbi:MAG: hypothetical protein HKP55_05715 [Gammaproteobacteria bacterium]|nr:hypothetical protein [Gammaproteobacteria bacterium]
MKSKGLTISAATGIALLMAMTAFAQMPLGGFRPASVPSKYFTPEEAIARAIVTSHQQELDNHSETILKNKALQETSGIAQQRVSQSVARLQGQKVKPAAISSTLAEINQVVMLLDDVLAEVKALKSADKAAYQQALNQRAAENLIRKTLPLYWEINGYRNTNGYIKQAINETRRLLDPFIRERNKQSAQEELQKKDLLQLLDDFKLMQKQNQTALENFSVLIGAPAEHIQHTLFVPVKNLSIYELALDVSQFDGNILKHWAADEAINLNAVNRYLSSLTPGLKFDWMTMGSASIRDWLSTGKNNAFDLYNQLDQLERKKLFKEKDKEKAKQQQAASDLLITSAAFTRAHLAMLQYLHSREVFTLSHCHKQITESLNAHKKRLLDDSIASSVNKLKLSKQYIENTQQYFRDYGALLTDLLVLKNSIFHTRPQPGLDTAQVAAVKRVIKKSLAQGTRKLDNSIYSCYQSEKQIAELAAQQAALQKEKQAETQRADQLAAKLDDLTNKEKLKKRAAQKARKDWVKQTRPRSWTLQLKTASDISTLEAFKRRYKLGKAASITETLSKGKVRYHLLYGTYGNKELAYIAQFKLPQSLQNNEKIWIRRYSDIQKQIK